MLENPNRRAGHRVRPLRSLLTALLATWTVALAAAAAPPVAPLRPSVTVVHGHERVDPYAWLRNRDDPAVIAYLEAENAFMKETLAHTEGLQETLYAEMVGRMKQTDLTVPQRDGPFLYYTRTVEGLEYPIFCRRGVSPGDGEEIALDVNELAKGHEYFSVTARDVSPDHRMLAYLADVTGYEAPTLFIKDLATGTTTEVAIEGIAPFDLAWAADGRTLFYGRTDETKRMDRVYRHVLGGDPARDVLVRREDDVKFQLGVRRTRSDALILVESHSSTTSEIWFVPAARPDAEPVGIAPRRQGVQYRVDHHPAGGGGGTFYVLTDDGAPNFKVVTAPVADPRPEGWRPLLAHDPAVYLEGHEVLRHHLVLSERRDGATELRVIRLLDGDAHVVALPERVAVVGSASNPDFDTTTYRFGYTSLITPPSVYDYDLDRRHAILLKREEVLGGYDPANYETARLWATAADGARVPISIVHRRGLERDGDNPCLLYGYGSYGASMEPWFDSDNLSLLDRGFVFAIAHVRGGAEMGRHWKEDGKMMHKRNTFTDFIACAEHLIAEKWTRPERLAIRGGSAGGLLIGAVVNMRPDLFAAAHAAVPFVDVVNTMLDASIPLTTGEYEEWGNPHEPAAYEYLMTYSPYDNVAAREYPDLLVTAGLNDPRVHYWEPAKWVARLRAAKTGDGMLVLKTNMGAGHGGASGRYARLRELALEYAFIIDRVGGY
jgi:oligopeptidase B